MYIYYIISLLVLLYYLSSPSVLLETYLDGDASQNIGNFDNFCLTQKPRGFGQPLCTWWRDYRPTITEHSNARYNQGHLVTQDGQYFSETGNNYPLKKVKMVPFLTQIKGQPLLVDNLTKDKVSLVKTQNQILDHLISYDPAYYLDSSRFCQVNPTHRLCPNHWISSK